MQRLKNSWFHLFMMLVSLLRTVSMQSECNYRYVSEPGSSMETCNIIGTGANITCYVEGTSSPEIQWYYTSDPSLAGVLNSTTLLNMISNSDYFVQPSFQAVNDLRIRKDDFMISKLDASTVGYYWCSVMDQPSPSQVVHIREQCNISTIHSCSHRVLLSQPSNNRCADAASQNVTIVAAQDLSCHVTTPPPTTTSTSKTVTTHQTTKTTPTETEEDKTSPVSTEEDKPFSTAPSTTSEDKTPTGIITEEKKPTLTSTTQSELIHTTQETSTFLPTSTTGDVSINVSPQSGGGLPTDVIWLAIGIVLTLLLVGVFALLTVIATLQWKKRKIKGASSHTSEVQGYAESRDTVIPLEDTTSQYKKAESDLDPVYAEIPSVIPANLLRLGVPNPFFTAPNPSTNVPPSPFSPADSGQYEDLSLQPRPVSRERITSTDGPGSGWSSNKRPSTSSAPQSPLPVINDIVFDDPKYEIVESSPVQKRRSKVQVTLSVPHENSRSDNENYNQSLSEFSTKSKLGRKFSLESHTYTPVIPTNSKEDNNYTFAIVNTEEKYVSEQGHLYHVLESSMQSEGEGSVTPNKPVSPVSQQSDVVIDEHVYSVLEESSSPRE